MQKALDAQAFIALAPAVERYAVAGKNYELYKFKKPVGGLGQPAGLEPRLNMTVGAISSNLMKLL